MKPGKEKIQGFELSNDEIDRAFEKYVQEQTKRDFEEDFQKQVERNEYRGLLWQSLYAFNALKNQRISESLNDTTYALAARISAAFKRFDN